MSIQAQTNCCDNLLAEFKFENLTTAEPPDEKGVYAIRIKSRNEKTPQIMIEKTRQLVLHNRWKSVEGYIMNRVGRLKKITDCPIIYIGSAGTQAGSKNTIRGRHKEFCSRHTAMYPIWVLIYFGWELEFGWKAVAQNPKHGEEELKGKYKKQLLLSTKCQACENLFNIQGSRVWLWYLEETA